MPLITDFTATNLSVVIQSGNYTSFPVWIIIFCAAIGLLVVSRLPMTHDKVGHIMMAAGSFIMAIAAVWASLSIAYLSYTTIPVETTNTTGNLTYTIVSSAYFVPIREVITSNWLTLICVIFLIISILNLADIIISEIQKIRSEKKDENRF